MEFLKIMMAIYFIISYLIVGYLIVYLNKTTLLDIFIWLFSPLVFPILIVIAIRFNREDKSKINDEKIQQ